MDLVACQVQHLTHRERERERERERDYRERDYRESEKLTETVPSSMTD